jgi:aldehyde dehydrogenase (NAD+)
MSIVEFRRFYIDGVRSAPAEIAPPIEARSSVTEETFERVPAGSATDVDRAVRAASAAFPSWSRLPLRERTRYLRRIATALRSRADVIAPAICEEVGMPIGGARGYQTDRAIEVLDSAADIAESLDFESRLEGSLIVQEPVGVVAAICPSNFPLLLSLNKVGPALATGCTVVLKAPETAPRSLFHRAAAAEEAGLLPGVLNVLTGYGPAVGEPLAAHPLVDMMSFPGSTRVGRRPHEIGSQTIKRAHMELGGKSAAILLDDAALEQSLRAAVGQAFINSGRVCFAWSRLLVPRARLKASEDILKGVVEEFRIGNPLDGDTTLGPIVASVARQNVRTYIADAVRDGARIVSGGVEMPAGLNRGYFVAPTILSEVDNGMRIAQEEVFGPVMSVIACDGDDNAVQIANDSIFGLHGAVFSADADRALAVARRLRTGQVDINGFKLGMYAPFGGFKQSGLGREPGRYEFQEYLEVKSIQL